jgi:Cu2+-exporting ATPase/Cu+-exporting ATPase
MSCCNCAAPAPVQSPGQVFPWLRAGFLILSGGLAMYLSLAINLSPATGLSRTVIHGILAIASGLALILAGAPIFRNALVPRITLEQLFLIGLCGSYAASLYSSITGIGHIYYEVVIILLAIYHFGQLITRTQIRRMESLENEIPGLRSTARPAGEETQIPITQVRTGQLIEVRPGEVIPADGIIESGTAFVEKLVHTGEPFPSPVGKNASILAGSRVLDGTLILRATAPGTDRELDRLLAACNSSSALPSESLAASILHFFVPAVIVISVLTVIAWIAIGETSRAFFNGLAVTIVACPCGLGLAVPLALRRSHARLRLLGFTPHVPDFLERLATTDTIAFDKTGTLTSPALSIKSIEPLPETPPALLSWLAAIQRQSTHPVARPFWDIAAPAILENLSITPIPGRGITARFSAEGKPHELTICNSLHLPDNFPQTNARTLHLILDSKITGHIVFSERSREGAVKALKNLKTAGYPTELLTGDSDVPAAIRGIIPCHTGLTATEKAALIKKQQSSGHSALLIGDGLNDTEAMRAAHISIALGPEAKAASSVASATLCHHDLSAIPQALALARATKKKLNRLLAFTLIYNFTGIALAASGLLHPVSAAILMLASSATVLFMAREKSH